MVGLCVWECGCRWGLGGVCGVGQGRLNDPNERCGVVHMYVAPPD